MLLRLAQSETLQARGEHQVSGQRPDTLAQRREERDWLEPALTTASTIWESNKTVPSSTMTVIYPHESAQQ